MRVLGGSWAYGSSVVPSRGAGPSTRNGRALRHVQRREFVRAGPYHGQIPGNGRSCAVAVDAVLLLSLGGSGAAALVVSSIPHRHRPARALRPGPCTVKRAGFLIGVACVCIRPSHWYPTGLGRWIRRGPASRAMANRRERRRPCRAPVRNKTRSSRRWRIRRRRSAMTFSRGVAAPSAACSRRCRLSSVTRRGRSGVPGSAVR